MTLEPIFVTNMLCSLSEAGGHCRFPKSSCQLSGYFWNYLYKTFLLELLIIEANLGFHSDNTHACTLTYTQYNTEKYLPLSVHMINFSKSFGVKIKHYKIYKGIITGLMHHKHLKTCYLLLLLIIHHMLVLWLICSLPIQLTIVVEEFTIKRYGKNI